MNISRENLDNFLKNIGVTLTEKELSKKLEEWREVDNNFLEILLKYQHVDIDKELLDRITPLPLYSLGVKCPLLIKHYLDKQPAYSYGINEKDSLVKLINNDNYKNISEEDMQLLLEEFDLNITSKTLNKVFDYVEFLLKSESDEETTARAHIDRVYSVTDEEGKPIVNFKNFISITGKDNYHVIYLKVTDHDYSEEYINNYFAENMFLSALAGMTKTDKNMKVTLLIVRPNDVLAPVRWHIPYNFLSKLGTTPGEMMKKYISLNFKQLPEDMTNIDKLVKLTTSKKIKYCSKCGYRYLKENIFSS